jgi:hypothetical protein
MARLKVEGMKSDSVRTTVDIPAPLYRKLKQRAAAEGSSIRQLVITGVKNLLAAEPPRRRRAHLPVIRSKGPKVNLTNEQIYGGIEFP